MSIDTRVALCARVVPNGLVRDTPQLAGQPRRIVGRVVVVLTPAAPKSPAPDASRLVPFEQWPGEAHRILDALKRVVPKDVNDRVEDGIPLRPPTGAVEGAADLDKVDRLWNLLMRAPRVGWDDLVREWTCPEQTPALHTGQLELYMPNGLAGLALPYARARQTLDGMAGPQGALASRHKARPAGDQLSAMGRPWLGEPNALERFASLGGSSQKLGDLRVLGPPAPWSALASMSKGPRLPDESDRFFLRSITEEEVVQSALGHDGRDMLPIFDRLHALHHAGLSAVEAAQINHPPVFDSSLARKRILHLMSSPSLMRLFGLARDYEVDLTDLPLGEDVLRKFSVAGPQDREVVTPWTAARYRGSDVANRGPRGFWAVSKEEWPSGKPAGIVAERDGVRLLPREPNAGESFGLISIEPALGLQSDLHAARAQRDEGVSPEQKQQMSASLRSAGLVLVRRPRNKRRDSGATSVCPPDAVDLFAEELAQFDRLDVGIDERDEKGRRYTSWRATTNRKLEHLVPKSLDEKLAPAWIDKFVADRLGADLKASLHELNGTYFTDSALLGSSEEGECEVRDERVAMWVGESGSIAFDAVDYDRPGKKAQMGRRTPLDAEAGPLALDYEARLPVQGDRPGDSRALLPMLRFGWRYRVGVRRVYLGGASLLLEDAERTYAHGERSFPPATDEEGFPYLRHEPIGAPESFLAPSEPASPDIGSDAQLQGTGLAVITTWNSPPEGRSSIASTARLLLVPRVPFEFAQLHEVFDEDKGESAMVPGENPEEPAKPYQGNRPSDGLQNVAFDDHVNALKVEDKKNGGRTTVEVPKAEEKPARLTLRGEKERYRPKPYYPDPLASFLVLRLKRFGSEADWLDEDPLIVPIQRTAGIAKWPNLMPVHVELRAAPNRPLDRGGQDGRLMVLRDRPRHMGPAGFLFVDGGSDTLAVQSVQVFLAAGERATLVAWLVPTVEDLAGCFDLCRTMSVLAEAEGRRVGIAPGKDAATCGLEHLIGKERCVPGSETPAAAALQLHMFREPVPAISNVRTLDLVHAVDRPVAAPSFVVAPPRTPRAPADRPDQHFPHFMAPKFARRLGSGDDKAPSFVARRRSSDDWSADSEDGGRYLVMGGRVSVEAASTSGVLIRASGVGLNGEKLDDPEQSVKPHPGRTPDLKTHPAGFAVRSDGTIEFARGVPAELVRIDGIPAPSAASPSGRGAAIRQRRIELDLANPEAYFESADQAKGQAKDAEPVRSTSPTLRVVTSQIIRDGGARWLSLSATALSRYRNFLAVVPVASQSATAAASGRELPDGAWGLTGRDRVHALVPATERPPPCFNPRLVVFNPPAESSKAVTVVDGVRRIFRPLVRLYLDRPWFSSGQGELVGIVFWPPLNAEGEDPGDLWSREFVSGLIPEDLGPLGAHVSTWGRNTRRNWEAATGWPQGTGAFLAPSAISDARPPDVSPTMISDDQPLKAEPPSNVLMPIPGTGEKPGEELLAQVAIKTFVPRFDPAENCWFVELNMDLGEAPDPFMRLALVRYQPWARPDSYANGRLSGIRCSLPVNASAWMRSRRTVEAKVDRTRTRDGAESVDVSVVVSGAIGAPPDLKQRDEQTKGRLPRPAVRIQLWQRNGSDDAVAEDVERGEAVWESWKRNGEESVLVRNPAFWNTSFKIAVPAIDRDAEYRVIVEEGEVMADVYDANDTNDVKFGLTRLISTLDVTALIRSKI